jgi:hypothetical protein
MKKIIFLLLVSLLPMIGYSQSTSYGCIIVNKPSGGVLTSGVSCTVDNSSTFKVRQTTAGQTITVPNSSSTLVRTIEVFNDSISGSVPFTLSPGGNVPLNKGIRLQWVGNKWVVVGKYLTSEELGLEFTSWNSSTAYISGNVVLYGGMVWRATGSSTNQTPGGGGPWTLEIVNTSAYSQSGWNGSLYAPTQDAVRDKIETIQDSISECIKQGYNSLSEPLILDSNKIGFGGAPSGLAHFVLPNDAAPLSKTSWTGVDVVFGQQGLAGKALGVSYTSGTNTINMNFLEPTVQWLNGQLNFGSLGFYSGGGALGFHQNQFGQIGINTNTSASGALLTIRGSDDSNDDYQLRTFNDSGDEIFSLRNDKVVSINGDCIVNDGDLDLNGNFLIDPSLIRYSGSTAIDIPNMQFRSTVNGDLNLDVNNTRLSSGGNVKFDWSAGAFYSNSGQSVTDYNDQTLKRYSTTLGLNVSVLGWNNGLAKDSSNNNSYNWFSRGLFGHWNCDSTFTAEKFQISALNTPPSSASDTGTTGEIRIDANYIYICTTTNTWKRVSISTW